MSSPETKAAAAVEMRGLAISYGAAPVISGIDLRIEKNTIHGWIGPAGSGKTSLLRTINLLSIDVDRAQAEGQLLVDGQDVLAGDVERASLRRRVGMVFATPQPLPRSIYENLVYGPRIAGVRDRATLDATVERSLRAAQLWDEVKDRLGDSALGLSGGQQQRLCIARAIAAEPEVLLMDEPCSALDPIATSRVEELILALRGDYTVLIVTHNMQQASRVSDYTAFMYLGQVVEYGPTAKLFTNPRLRETEDYITGRFG